jgi:Protein kinase domain
MNLGSKVSLSTRKEESSGLRVMDVDSGAGSLQGTVATPPTMDAFASQSQSSSGLTPEVVSDAELSQMRMDALLRQQELLAQISDAQAQNLSGVPGQQLTGGDFAQLASGSRAPPLSFVEHQCSGNTFLLPPRYGPPLRLVGAGAYGVVVAATDTSTGGTVAIKRIGNCFKNLKDTKRIVREIRLMRHFQHENVLPVLDVFVPEAKDEFSDVYIISPLMDSDLQQIIGSSQELSDDHCQYFIYQVLRGLKAIHSAHVLHRDLKPSNLILNGDCQLKICDLGLARVANPSDDWTSYLTEYVATRWYRAPEVILSWKRYTKAIDVWSVGCIFSELLARRPVFPGSSYIHQISAITDVLGTPPEDEIANISSEPARRFIRQLGFKPRVPLAQLHPNATPLALDLLDKLLQFDPIKRITVEEALAHPYLASLHDGSDEPEGAAAFNFDFEDYELTEEVFRDLLWQEMVQFHPECAGL